MERSTKDRWLLGVCGGIAHRLGWSANVVRSITVLLAILVPGISVIPALAMYVVLGLVLSRSETF